MKNFTPTNTVIKIEKEYDCNDCYLKEICGFDSIGIGLNINYHIKRINEALQSYAEKGLMSNNEELTIKLNCQRKIPMTEVDKHSEYLVNLLRDKLQEYDITI